jgi:hypothetical protein
MPAPGRWSKRTRNVLQGSVLIPSYGRSSRFGHEADHLIARYRGRAITLTFDQFKYGWTNALDEDEAKRLYEAYHAAGSGIALAQMANANLNPWTEAKVDTKNLDRGPLLILDGEKDHTVPWAIANASYKRQKRNPSVTEIKKLPNRGHSLTIDHGWQEVAQTALDFVKRFVPAKPSWPASISRRNFSAGGTPTNEHHVLVCIGVVDVDVDALETGVVDHAAPRGVREDAEEVVVVLDTQRLSRLSQCDREVNAVRGTRRHNVAAADRRSAAVAMATPARRAALRRHLRAPRDPDPGLRHHVRATTEAYSLPPAQIDDSYLCSPSLKHPLTTATAEDDGGPVVPVRPLPLHDG